MPDDLATSGLAAAALALARAIDSADGSPTSKSMCAKTLLEICDRLRSLKPADEEADELDDLQARRVLRLEGRPAS